MVNAAGSESGIDHYEKAIHQQKLGSTGIWHWQFVNSILSTDLIMSLISVCIVCLFFARLSRTASKAE